MNNYIYISNSANDTMNLAYKIASQLNKGDTIVLTGDLGAGKTKFTEGFLKYFHLENEISSPTFTIVNEYTSNDINIYHFDVYRLEDSSEFYAIGGEEYFDNGICLIEWGEIIEDALPSSYIHILFEKDESNVDKRVIKINIIGNKFDNLVTVQY